MEEKIQDKINKVLDSFDQLDMVEPSPFLFGKIKHKIETRKAGNELEFVFPVWKLAIGFVVLLGINISILTYFLPNVEPSSEALNDEEVNTGQYYEIY